MLVQHLEQGRGSGWIVRSGSAIVPYSTSSSEARTSARKSVPLRSSWTFASKSSARSGFHLAYLVGAGAEPEPAYAES